jgi:hypothetical protein
MDIAAILSANYVGSEWSLNGDDYAGLVWLSESQKPTEKELENQWAEVQNLQAMEIVRQARQVAYQQTADPLFFKFQAGEATEQEWLTARQEVVDANPYPAKSK